MADSPPSAVALRLPSRYAQSPSTTPDALAFTTPPPEWLHRTWAVTHSTLSMWRTARNVRISYTPLPPKPAASSSSPADPLPRNQDLVEYESSSGKGGVKTVSGANSASGPAYDGSWEWRGRGWLFFVTSHWEVLGWGERTLPGQSGGVERWAVTWFAATLFTKEGIDVYSDRKEGISEALLGEIMAALKGLAAKELVVMCEKDMRPVEIKLPWKER